VIARQQKATPAQLGNEKATIGLVRLPARARHTPEGAEGDVDIPAIEVERLIGGIVDPIDRVASLGLDGDLHLNRGLDVPVEDQPCNVPSHWLQHAVVESGSAVRGLPRQGGALVGGADTGIVHAERGVADGATTQGREKKPRESAEADCLGDEERIVGAAVKI
jgi:hypothetical protein